MSRCFRSTGIKGLTSRCTSNVCNISTSSASTTLPEPLILPVSALKICTQMQSPPVKKRGRSRLLEREVGPLEKRHTRPLTMMQEGGRSRFWSCRWSHRGLAACIWVWKRACNKSVTTMQGRGGHIFRAKSTRDTASAQRENHARWLSPGASEGEGGREGGTQDISHFHP